MRRAVLLGVFAGCAPVEEPEELPAPTAEERVEAFAAPGPYRVGYRETSVTYDDPVSEAERTLRVGLWYPTDDTSGRPMQWLGPHSPDDVLLETAAAPGPHPLFMFSHGHRGDIDNATHLMAHAASHGWVVAAPEHTGNTLSDGEERDTETYVQRPGDVSATIDALLADDSELGGLDGRIFATGHSFGGYTMFPLAGSGWDVDWWGASCADGLEDDFCSTWSPHLVAQMEAGKADDRIGAFATMSGGNWGQLREAGLATTSAPLLLISGALDGSVSNEANSDLAWRDIPAGHKMRVDIGHGDHQTYTDFADSLPGILPGTSADALDADRGYRVLYVHLLAWASSHVLGKTEGLSDILDGTLVVDDDLTLSWK